MAERLGLIAGNGTFPLKVLEGALRQGAEVFVAAIKEETDPEIESGGATSVEWLSLGNFERLIQMFKDAGVTRAIMAGQIKHRHIFSSIDADSRLAGIVTSLATRNADALLGAIATAMAREGIALLDSSTYVGSLLVRSGVLSHRAPNERETVDLEIGRTIARQIARADIGQTVVIASAACIAVEAMEGTDETILRAGRFLRGLAGSSTLLSRALTVVKVAKPGQDMRFDVPAIGPSTIDTMRAAGATCLALDAGKCLLFDDKIVLAAADEAGIAIVADHTVE